LTIEASSNLRQIRIWNIRIWNKGELF